MRVNASISGVGQSWKQAVMHVIPRKNSKNVNVISDPDEKYVHS